jgi:putative membrane protein
MKRILAMLVVAAPLAAAALAFGADSNPDASFFKNAAEGGLFEVKAGNQAEQKANSQRVKDFGAMMVKDHTAASAKLGSIAASKNITLPTSPSVEQMATLAKLDVLTGDAYDKSYIRSQIKAHEETVELFKKEIASGQDADAKAFAAATLPTVEHHLKAAKAIASEAGYNG